MRLAQLDTSASGPQPRELCEGRDSAGSGPALSTGRFQFHSFQPSFFSNTGAVFPGCLKVLQKQIKDPWKEWTLLEVRSFPKSESPKVPNCRKSTLPFASSPPKKKMATMSSREINSLQTPKNRNSKNQNPVVTSISFKPKRIERPTTSHPSQLAIFLGHIFLGILHADSGPLRSETPNPRRIPDEPHRGGVSEAQLGDVRALA